MIYNYKSDEVVQDVVLDSMNELLEDIEEEYDMLHRDGYLLVYAQSYIVKKIIIRLLADVDGSFVHEDSEVDLLDKDNDVLLSIANDGMLFVETAKGVENKFKYTDDCALAYVYDGFSKKDVDELAKRGDSILVFGFKEEDTEKKDIDKTVVTDYKGNKVAEFYSVNGKEVSKEEYENVLEKFNDKYMDNIQDMLLNHMEFVNEMHNFARLFNW